MKPLPHYSPDPDEPVDAHPPDEIEELVGGCTETRELGGEKVQCELRTGHETPHRAHGPHGIEFTWPWQVDEPGLGNPILNFDPSDAPSCGPGGCT